MTSTSHDEIYRRGVSIEAKGMLMAGSILAVLGMGGFIAFTFGGDPARAWRIFHVNFLFFTGLSIGPVIFAAIQKVTKGKWAGPVIRFAEAGVAFVPVSLLLFLILFLGRNHLFPWIAHPTPARGLWLTVPFVFLRDLVALLAVFGVAIAFVYYDLKPDVAQLRDSVTGWRRRIYDRVAGDYTGQPEQVAKNEHRIHWLAPLLIVVYAYMFSVIGFDLIMSLAPFWISNLFGAFFFMGAFLTGLTLLGLMMVYWRRKLGLHEIIGRQQFHDLGKLVFGFSVFWAYLMYSQVMIIWYGNLREETAFVFPRLYGEWLPFSIAVGLMVFLIPFWGLIWVKAKITISTVVLFFAISISGVWLERFVLVQPSLTAHPLLGLPEVVVTLGFVGLFLITYALFARAFPMISPRLARRALELHH